MTKINYKENYKYTLLGFAEFATNIRPAKTIETEFITLQTDGWLFLEPGYSWDGATFAVDTESFLRASLVHDALYQLIRLNLLPQSSRAAADGELVRVARADGMMLPRRWWVWVGVRCFGWGATRPESAEPAE
jgi:hypothetical protein